MMDIGRQFEQAKALVRAPWWRRLLHKPAHTIIPSNVLWMRPFVPFVCQLRPRTFFDREFREILENDYVWIYSAGSFRVYRHQTHGKIIAE